MKNTNNNPATEVEKQIIPKDNAWLVKPLSNQDRITKANNVQFLVNETKRQLGLTMEDEC